MTDVHWRGSRQQFRELMRSVIAACQGHGPDVGGVAHGVFLSVGFAALGDIQQDFIRKSRRETPECGSPWPELSPQTIARRRLGDKRDPKSDWNKPNIAARLKAEKAAKREALAKFNAEAKRKQAERLKREYKILLSRFRLSLPPDEATARAKQIIDLRRRGLEERTAAERKAADFALRGKFAVTRETKQTRVSVFADRTVDILRDTGVGLTSLSQGELSGQGANATYQKPTTQGRTDQAKEIRAAGQQQVFEELKDGIIIGTNVPYMADHQNGVGVPQRAFLPIGPIPRIWGQRWADAGLEALTIGVTQLVTATA